MTTNSSATTRVFTITLDGADYAVEAESAGDSRWTVSVNGRTFVVEQGENGRVLVDGIAYDLAVEDERVREGDVSYPLGISGLQAGTARRAPVARGPSLASRGPGDGAVVAIMPGQITRVLVEEGQDVEAGEAVCVLEAMKMENELRSDRAGVVKAVHAAAGQDVEKDDVLVEIE